MFNFFLSADTGSNGTDMLVTIGMLVLVIVAFYFFLIRPQKKQEKQAAEMRDALEVGDEITTIGGIIGQIVSIKGETITIVTSKARTKIRFLRTAVRSVDVKANAPAPLAEEAAPAVEKKTEEAPAAIPSLNTAPAVEPEETAAPVPNEVPEEAENNKD